MFTFQQIADLFYQRIDQAGSPAYTPQETDRILNQAYRAWYEQNRPRFNKEQGVTVNMTHLLLPFSFTNTATITLAVAGSNLPLYKDLAKMKGQWSETDCNGATMLVWRSIVPTPLNAVDTNSQDPFNRATDKFPQYKQDNNGTFRTISIQSTTVPLQLEGSFFQVVPNINSENNPMGVFSGPDKVVDDIVELAKALFKTDVDDYESVEETLKEYSAKV